MCSYFCLSYLLGHVLGVRIIAASINTLVTSNSEHSDVVLIGRVRQFDASTHRFPTLALLQATANSNASIWIWNPIPTQFVILFKFQENDPFKRQHQSDIGR